MAAAPQPRRRNQQRESMLKMISITSFSQWYSRIYLTSTAVIPSSLKAETTKGFRNTPCCRFHNCFCFHPAQRKAQGGWGTWTAFTSNCWLWGPFQPLQFCYSVWFTCQITKQTVSDWSKNWGGRKKPQEKCLVYQFFGCCFKSSDSILQFPALDLISAHWQPPSEWPRYTWRVKCQEIQNLNSIFLKQIDEKCQQEQ